MATTTHPATSAGRRERTGPGSLPVGLAGRAGRSDIGARTLEQVLLIFILMVVAVPLAALMVGVVHRYGQPLSPAPVLAWTGLGLTVAAVLLLVGCVVEAALDRRRSERPDAVRLARVRHRVGTDLARWLRCATQRPVSNDELEQWLRWEQDGLSAPVAQVWHARGYLPASAAAAVRVDAGLEQVERLAALVRQFEPDLDCYQLSYLVGRRGTRTGLGDWLAHPPEQVRWVVADEIARSGGGSLRDCADAILGRLRRPSSGPHCAWSATTPTGGPQDCVATAVTAAADR